MKKIAVIMEYFNISIDEINKSNNVGIEKINQKIAISIDCLGKLRDILRNNQFSSPDEEIYYFKYQKPIILGKLEYYRKQKEYLIEKPIITISKQKESILNELNRIDNENIVSFEFVKYYRLNQDELDHLFFIRGNEHFEMFLISPHQIHDPEFSSQHDYLVAKIITNELLLKFYNKELLSINYKESNIIVDENIPNSFKGLQWTATKTELLELIKGLEASGSINNGNIDMKRANEICKDLFGVDLGNYNKAYTQIKERKKDTTKYIDKLKISLQNKVDTENRNL